MLHEQKRAARLKKTLHFTQSARHIIDVAEHPAADYIVERRVLKRKALAVCDAEREPGLVLPAWRRLHVDRHDLPHALPQEACDTAVAAADVEERLGAAKCVTELVDAPQSIAKLPRVSRRSTAHSRRIRASE